MATTPSINSETNSPSPIINVVSSICGSFLAQASVFLPCQYTATWSRGGDLFLQSGSIPEFQEVFPDIELVSVIYVRYCDKI